MKSCALVIVDVQNAIINEGPFQRDAFITCLKDILTLADKNDVEVIYVQHDDGQGTELERGTEGWKIYSEIAPKEGTYIVDKTFNSAFHGTTFDAYLRSKGYKTLIIAGMQTEYCMDATIKSAFDLGYEVIIPAQGHTTMSNGLFEGEHIVTFFTDYIWRGRFAKILSLNEIETFLA